MAQVARFHYYDYVEDRDNALAVSALSAEFRRALMLYRQGDYEKALEAADRAVAQGSVMSRVERGFILAERRPDGPGQAAASFQEAAVQRDLGFWRLCQPMILLLLGKEDEAVQASRKVRDDPTVPVPPWYEGWYYQYQQYQCDQMREDELVQAAAHCRPKLCEARFMIGLRRLARGDRDGAGEHFQRCIDTRVFIYWD
jgi:tetratricopeptide (TPR) repeat protein